MLLRSGLYADQSYPSVKREACQTGAALSSDGARSVSDSA
jgi:hypothetical protein